jgi:hypothetical protein
MKESHSVKAKCAGNTKNDGRFKQYESSVIYT